MEKINGVMYGKFNNKDKSGSLLMGNKKGVIVINKSFNKVLDEVKTKEIDRPVTKETAYNPMDEIFIWQAAFDKRRRGI